MEWALGFIGGSYGQSVELVEPDGGTRSATVDDLLKVGVPRTEATKRLVFEGELSDFAAYSGERYLEAFGFSAPILRLNRHEVLRAASNGIEINVPALVLMRAMFKPGRYVLPAMFSPANIDSLSYVDYGGEVPKVVVDEPQCRKQINAKVYGVSQAEPLRWLQTSRSARGSCHEIHMRALQGILGMRMPGGQAKIVFHGLRKGNCLFATKASIVTVSIAAEDSITSRHEKFIFNANVEPSGAANIAKVADVRIPPRRDGGVALTDLEWKAIEPLLNGKKPGPAVHSKRDVLDVILRKLTGSTSWRKMDLGSLTVTDVTAAFRRWCLDGRMQRVTTVLETLRLEGSSA